MQNGVRRQELAINHYRAPLRKDCKMPSVTSLIRLEEVEGSE